MVVKIVVTPLWRVLLYYIVTGRCNDLIHNVIKFLQQVTSYSCNVLIKKEVVQQCSCTTIWVLLFLDKTIKTTKNTHLHLEFTFIVIVKKNEPGLAIWYTQHRYVFQFDSPGYLYLIQLGYLFNTFNVLSLKKSEAYTRIKNMDQNATTSVWCTFRLSSLKSKCLLK